jgi:site-specific recombinase XerD
MSLSVTEAIERYLDAIAMARSINTARTYRNALAAFGQMLDERSMPPNETSVTNISEDAISWFAHYLKEYSSATERLYLTAIKGFYEYLSSECLAQVEMSRVRTLIRLRARRPGQRLPQFSRDNIEKVLGYAENLHHLQTENERDALRNYRDRAFLLTLADTGLRVHEACQLRRGDLDWNEGKAIVIGKGDRQDLVRFSRRSITALQDYLALRGNLDGSSGRPLTSLPLFARHDKGAGSKIKPISTVTGRNIVAQRVLECLGDTAIGTITPHSFRHYFVTTVLAGSSGNLKLAQELARHRNIAITQRYAHLTNDELDIGYHKIFED